MTVHEITTLKQVEEILRGASEDIDNGVDVLAKKGILKSIQMIQKLIKEVPEDAGQPEV